MTGPVGLAGNKLKNIKEGALAESCSFLPIESDCVNGSHSQFKKVSVYFTLMLCKVWLKEPLIYICSPLK
jgi:hypothetical protein